MNAENPDSNPSQHIGGVSTQPIDYKRNFMIGGALGIIDQPAPVPGTKQHQVWFNIVTETGTILAVGDAALIRDTLKLEAGQLWIFYGRLARIKNNRLAILVGGPFGFIQRIAEDTPAARLEATLDWRSWSLAVSDRQINAVADELGAADENL